MIGVIQCNHLLALFVMIRSQSKVWIMGHYDCSDVVDAAECTQFKIAGIPAVDAHLVHKLLPAFKLGAVRAFAVQSTTFWHLPCEIGPYYYCYCYYYYYYSSIYSYSYSLLLLLLLPTGLRRREQSLQTQASHASGSPNR